MGTRIIGTCRNIAPRQLRQTSFHPLDFAITGNGYFAIILKQGNQKYVRLLESLSIEIDQLEQNIIDIEAQLFEKDLYDQ